MPNLTNLTETQLQQELTQAISAEKKLSYLIEIAYRQTNEYLTEGDMRGLQGILLQATTHNIDQVNDVVSRLLSPVSSMIAMAALYFSGQQKEIFIPNREMETQYRAFSKACGIPSSVLSQNPQNLSRTELHEKYAQASSPEARLPYAAEIAYRATGRLLNSTELYAIRLALAKPTSERDEAIKTLPPSSQRIIQMVQSSTEPQGPSSSVQQHQVDTREQHQGNEQRTSPRR